MQTAPSAAGDRFVVFTFFALHAFATKCDEMFVSSFFLLLLVYCLLTNEQQSASLARKWFWFVCWLSFYLILAIVSTLLLFFFCVHAGDLSKVQMSSFAPADCRHRVRADVHFLLLGCSSKYYYIKISLWIRILRCLVENLFLYLEHGLCRRWHDKRRVCVCVCVCWVSVCMLCVC